MVGLGIGTALVLLVLTVALTAAPAAAQTPSASASPRPGAGVRNGDAVPSAAGEYQRPVDTPIIDHFRPPATPYAAGNRGVDFATSPGTPVRAMGAGVVVFAGQVGGELHVTIEHPDGLRSSYSYLAAIEPKVRTGSAVEQGAVIGTAGDLLHVGVRDASERYLDPEGLWRAGASAHLVPSGDDHVMPATVDEPGVLARVLAEQRPHLPSLRQLGHLLLESRPEVHAARMATGMAEWYRNRDDCTPAESVPARPPGRRILLEVAGIGSTSEQAAIDRVDAGSLGYGTGDVLRFSYAGGRIPARGGGPPVTPDLDAVPATRYTSATSQEDLRLAAERLDDLLRQLATAAPGVPIDIVAHSQGGVVARLALAGASQRGRVPPSVQTLVTLGSPHAGADLAAVVAAGRVTHGGATAQDAVVQVTGLELDPTAPAARQLVAGSEVFGDLDHLSWPPSVRFTSVGARGDAVVTANRTVVAGARHTIVAVTGLHAHDQLPGSPEVTREIALAVAGAPPTCRDAIQVATDLAVSEQLSLTESAAAVALGGGLVASGH